MERENHIGVEGLVVIPTGHLDEHKAIAGERGGASVSGKGAHTFDRPSGGQS
ncbi:hypothetical protein ACGFSI_18970 [Streptomyces virginiae]|uniref:hypothetical protein n=1 Tax=Streptomyces virginiae TaxID=1961 RepID=UPI003713E1C9